MVTGGEKKSEIVVNIAGNLMGYKIIHNQDACKHEGTLKFPALKLKCIFPHSKELRLRKSGDNILPWCDCSKQVI